MRLSLHADYGLRVLLYLGAHPGEIVATKRISEAYGISKNHLVRVMQTLGEQGYIRVIPGRAGGVTLAKEPSAIRLGEVVRDIEPTLDLVECFDPATNTCPIIGACGLKFHLRHALNAFMADLNQNSLADLISPSRRKTLLASFVIPTGSDSIDEL